MTRLLLIISFALLGTSAQATSRQKLSLTGSSTVAPLALEIGKAFESLNKNTRVNIQTGGSTRGIIEARQGLNDIGMISRGLKSSESDLLAYPIAKDGIAIIVHKSNPIKKITRQQVIELFTKNVDNWKKLGGPNKPIVVVNKAEGRSTLELFLKHFGLKNKQIKADMIIGDNEQGVKAVSGNPLAIGYVSVGTVEVNAQLGTPIKALSLDGIAASTTNIKNGTYPLSRTLNLVVKTRPDGLKKTFIDYAQSQKVNAIVERLSFVPLHN